MLICSVNCQFDFFCAFFVRVWIMLPMLINMVILVNLLLSADVNCFCNMNLNRYSPLYSTVLLHSKHIPCCSVRTLHVYNLVQFGLFDRLCTDRAHLLPLLPNISIPKYLYIALHRYTNTAYHDTPIQQYLDTPIQQYTDTPICRYCDTAIQRYNDFIDIPIFLWLILVASFEY